MCHQQITARNPWWLGIALRSNTNTHHRAGDVLLPPAYARQNSGTRALRESARSLQLSGLNSLISLSMYTSPHNEDINTIPLATPASITDYSNWLQPQPKACSKYLKQTDKARIRCRISPTPTGQITGRPINTTASLCNMQLGLLLLTALQRRPCLCRAEADC